MMWPTTLAQFNEALAVHLDEPCPKCRAAPGAPCVDKHGEPLTKRTFLSSTYQSPPHPTVHSQREEPERQRQEAAWQNERRRRDEEQQRAQAEHARQEAERRKKAAEERYARWVDFFDYLPPRAQPLLTYDEVVTMLWALLWEQKRCSICGAEVPRVPHDEEEYGYDPLYDEPEYYDVPLRHAPDCKMRRLPKPEAEQQRALKGTG